MIKDAKEKNDKTSIDTIREEKINEVILKFTDKNGNFDYENFKTYVKQSGKEFIKEGYGLNFLGKRAAELMSGLESTTIFIPDIEHNEKEENKNSENIYISADNLEALRHLRHSYYKKIKCIYIDPPYNTGSDGFCYPDSFSYDVDDVMEKLGVSEEEANRILKMQSKRTNSHSAWLSFMYARLLIAKDLLSDDGAIFISIDDHEMANLKLLCDIVFNENNYVTYIPRISSFQRSGQEKYMNVSHDYILVYAMGTNFQNVTERMYEISNSGEKLLNGKKILTDKNGDYIEGDTKAILAARSQGYSKNGDYDFEYNNKVYKPINKNGERNRWLWVKDRMEAAAKLGILVETENSLRMQIYLNKKFEEGTNILVDKEDKLIFHTADFMKEKFDNATGTTELKNLFENKELFSNPKSSDLIRNVINLNVKDGDIVLDFFSGSGTTAHAILKQNSLEHSSNIKFIMVQLPENIDELLIKSKNKDIEKNQLFLCDTYGYPHTLDYIGIERIKRAAKKIKEETGADIDYGFKHFTLVDKGDKEILSMLERFDPNLAEITQDEILNEFSIESRLITFLCDDGYGLTPKYEKVDLDGYIAYYIDKSLYLLDKGFDVKQNAALVKYIEKLEDNKKVNRLVLFGYAFSTREMQQLKDNLEKFEISDENIIVKY